MFVESLSFPDVLTPMKNGQYLFYPQSVITDQWAIPDYIPEQVKGKLKVRIDVEEWEKNEDWNRSCINLPFNFFDERESLLIFKV